MTLGGANKLVNRIVPYTELESDLVMKHVEIIDDDIQVCVAVYGVCIHPEIVVRVVGGY